MADNNSVQTSQAVSDDRVRLALKCEIDRAINLDRSITRRELAERSGVNIHTIDQILSRIEEKQRRVALADALSIAWALGDRCVNALLMKIGYGGATRLDEPDALQPMQMVATAFHALSTITTAAADGRIDHIEQPACQEAADIIIATMVPLSSARTGA